MQTPQVLFEDRLLICSDCNTEFIFTAGEQLFFHDKQFKNDPKRCKPCKSRRSGLSAVANGTGPAAAGLSRTETRTECSECGIQTTVPFKPTQGRPVLCRHCFQLKGKAATLPVTAPLAPPAYVIAEAEQHAQTVSNLTQASIEDTGMKLSPEAATLAVTSMAAASAQSSVASAADLASILRVGAAPVVPAAIPAELIVARNPAAEAPSVPLHTDTPEA
jgi:CxxC-x17-CxxC domain-containing protein